MRTHNYGVKEASEDESEDTTTVTVPEIEIRFSEHALRDPLNSFGADRPRSAGGLSYLDCDLDQLHLHGADSRTGSRKVVPCKRGLMMATSKL